MCEALEEKALEAKETQGESWAVVSRMRDHLLSTIERKDVALWKQVRTQPGTCYKWSPIR